MNRDYKLIFALVSHHCLGYIVEAHRISILQSGQWSVEIKKISDFSSQYLTFDLNDAERELLEMTQLIREENVYSHFGLLKERKLTSTNTYFTEQTCQKYLIPYVSKHTAVIIDKIIEYDFPLHLKNEQKGVISESPLRIESQYAEPRFFFHLTDKEFKYALTVFQQDKKLSLADVKIISRIPCFLIADHVLYSIPDDFDGQLLKPFTKSETISIPKSKVKEYLHTFVSKIIKKYRVDVCGFSVTEIYPDPKPQISISRLYRKMPVIELSFRYDTEIFPANTSHEFILKLLSSEEDTSFIKVFRDESTENLVIQQLESFGFQLVQPGFFTCRNNINSESPVTVMQLLAEISRKSVLLKNIGVEMNIVIDSRTYHFDEPHVSTEISPRNDWFDLKMIVKFNNFTIPFQKIIPNIISGNQEFTLPDGSIAVLPEEWFSRYKDLSILSEKHDKGIKIHKSQINLIDSADTSEAELISDKLKSLIKNQIPCRQTPEQLMATLRDYQKKGFEWLTYMHECGLGGCLADDMGLGKTVQILTYFLHLNQNCQVYSTISLFETSESESQLSLFLETESKRKSFTHLIVAPLSLLHNWQDEILKFAPSLKIILYSGTERFRMYHDFHYADIVLTSYGVIRNDADILQHFNFHTIVLDESQFIKNPDSKSYDALLMLNSKQRFVLTGTPLENSLTDIWTQMNFLNPSMLGPLKVFKDTYVVPVEKNNDLDASKRIQKLIGSFILRRTKKEVTPELPLLTEKICYCTMTDEQKSIYEQKKSEIRNYLIENSGTIHQSRRNIIVLSGLMKLRLIANHPRLIQPDYRGNSGKFEEICQHIEKVVSEGHKTILFSQFIKHLNIIREYLDERNMSYELLTGKTSQADRQKNIRNFMENEKVRLFLMTLKAGGVGLNLTKADYVFVLDPWWNPATENQAINRTHRIGQDKKIFAYRFISSETIEEKIMVLQQKKSILFQNIINSASFGKLSESELLTLFE
jgi:superfamily II DNA or RNA helicase